jgi:hypothetical protein
MSENNTRNCPSCGILLTYTLTSNMLAAEKKQKKCMKCALKNRNTTGKNNPFFGKTHSKKTKELISKANLGRILGLDPRKSLKGDKNPMYGKSFYDIWLEKYGKTEADKRLNKFKKTQSTLNSGENNAMYGKPSPKGSGNGWSGWYKDWYFRSLLELSFMINVIERFKFTWENGEKKKYTIPYINYNNISRTYRPDFILNNKFMVECKPKKLHTTPLNKLKAEAAKKFCKKNGLKYHQIDCKKLSQEEIKKLYEKEDIKFIDKYNDKYKKQ